MTAAWTPRAAGPLAYAAALVLAVALTGCASGGSTPPVPSPTSTTPPASTSSPPPTPSATTTADPVIAKIPAPARRESEQGAAAYAIYYFSELNSAFRSADSSRLKGLSDEACVTCEAFSSGVDDLKSKKRRYGDDLVKVSRSSALNFTDSSRQVLVEIEQRRVPVLSDNGVAVDSTPAGKASFVASMRYEKHRWLITRLQKAKS